MSLLDKKTADTHSNASTQINVPRGAAEEIVRIGRQLIPDEHLAGDGREELVHVTLKFGVRPDVEAFRRAVAGQPPFKAVLGKVVTFPDADTDGIPVVVEVHGHGFKPLHDAIDAAISARPDDFPYTAHITVAYVKEAEAQHYAGNGSFEGIEFVAEAATISLFDDDNQVDVPLAKTAASPAVVPELPEVAPQYRGQPEEEEVERDEPATEQEEERPAKPRRQRSPLLRKQPKPKPYKAPKPPAENRNFKRWFGKSKVRDDEGNPMVVYHGTTHDFEAFDPSHANVENYYGKALYFTSGREDLHSNYSTESGPDITSRIEHHAERVMQEWEDQWDDAKDDLGLGDIEQFPNWSNVPGSEYERVKERAMQEAKGQVAGKTQGMSMPVYLSLQNPVVVEQNGGTHFELDIDEDGNESGSGLDLYNAMNRAAAGYDGGDAQEVWGKLVENYGESFNAWDFEKFARGAYFEDSEGNQAAGSFISDVYREMGFDGIIQDAYGAFGSRGGKPMQMEYGTKHYILWDPHKIKSAIGNVGKYDPRNPNITAAGEKSVGDLGLAKRIVRELMPVLGVQLPEPELKVVNQSRATWLGRDTWYTGHEGKTLYGDETTTVSLQRSILKDENTLRRVIAHELAHHADNLVNGAKLIEKWQGTGRIGYGRLQSELKNDGHGNGWKAFAQKYNAKFGADFVTEKSDESYVLEDLATKPYFISLWMKPNGKIYYATSMRLGTKGTEFMWKLRAKPREDVRVTMADDRSFVSGSATLGDGRWTIPTDDAENEKLRALWDKAATAPPMDLPNPWVKETRGGPVPDAKLLTKYLEQDGKEVMVKPSDKKDFSGWVDIWSRWKAASKNRGVVHTRDMGDKVVAALNAAFGPDVTFKLVGSVATAGEGNDIDILVEWNPEHPDPGFDDEGVRKLEATMERLGFVGPGMLEHTWFFEGAEELGTEGWWIDLWFGDEGVEKQAGKRDEAVTSMTVGTTDPDFPMPVLIRWEQGMRWRGVLKAVKSIVNEIAGKRVAWRDIHIWSSLWDGREAQDAGWEQRKGSHIMYDILHNGSHVRVDHKWTRPSALGATDEKLADSHKVTPLDDTYYNDPGIGEETNAYAEIPERVRGTYDTPPLRTLAPQLFKEGAGVAFRTEFRGSHDGQSDITLIAEVGGQPVGHVEYSVYHGKPAVQYISVTDKRKGYGTALLRKLQSMFPGSEVGLGGTTPEGTKLVESLEFREEPTEHAPKFEELETLTRERDRLQAVADEFYAGGGHTEEQKQAFMQQMDEMNKIHDRIWELEQETRHESPSRRLISALLRKAARPNFPPTFVQFAKKHGGVQKVIGDMGDAWNHYAEFIDQQYDNWDEMNEQERDAALEQLAVQDMEERYQERAQMYNSIDFPVDVYREISLENPKDLKTKGIGVFWAWSEDRAEAHWGTGSDHVMLHAVLTSPNQIDWDSTMFVNLDPSIGEAEDEARLKDGTRLRLVEVEAEKEIPLKLPMTVTAVFGEAQNQVQHTDQRAVGLTKTLKNNPFADELEALKGEDEVELNPSLDSGKGEGQPRAKGEDQVDAQHAQKMQRAGSAKNDISTLTFEQEDSAPEGFANGYIISAWTPSRLRMPYSPDELPVGRIDVIVDDEEKEPWVFDISVEDDWRGTGLGQALYDRAIAEARKRGFHRFNSSTDQSPEARAAWTRLGKRYPMEKLRMRTGEPYSSIRLAAKGRASDAQRIFAVLSKAELDGFGGKCAVAAIAINNVVFGGKGKMIAAYNKAFWERFASFKGHVAVTYQGRYWDAEGETTLENIESWGMLDPGDLDYAEEFGEGWNEQVAEETATKEFKAHMMFGYAALLPEYEKRLRDAMGKTASAKFPPFEQWVGKHPEFANGDPEELEERYSENTQWLSGLDLPLEIYRALEVEKGSPVNTDSAGVHWTWVENSADAYFGGSSLWARGSKPRKPELVILKAVVSDPNDIDFGRTLFNNVQNPDENEITLRQGAEIGLVGIMRGDDNDYRPAGKTVTARQVVSGEDVVSYVQKLNKWDRNTAYQVVGLDAGGDYVLRDFPLSKLVAGDDYDPERAKQYSRMDGPFPPIVLGSASRAHRDKPIMVSYHVIRDGNHRVAAAKLRGDTKIRAYVPIDTAKTAAEKPVVEVHGSGDVIWIDMFSIPAEWRGKGHGAKVYRDWEAKLPKSFKLIRLYAGDTGAGQSNGFWEKMGFSYVYDTEQGDQTDNYMWKGVNGSPTPKPLKGERDQEGYDIEDEPENA